MSRLLTDEQIDAARDRAVAKLVAIQEDLDRRASSDDRELGDHSLKTKKQPIHFLAGMLQRAMLSKKAPSNQEELVAWFSKHQLKMVRGSRPNKPNDDKTQVELLIITYCFAEALGIEGLLTAYNAQRQMGGSDRSQNTGRGR